MVRDFKTHDMDEHEPTTALVTSGDADSYDMDIIGNFFEEAADDREKLVSEFDEDCIGRR